MRKSVRITNSNREELWNACDQRIAAEKAKRSTGADQKAREIDIRDMLNAEGISYSGDLRARSTNRSDLRVKDAEGMWIDIEVKHGAGAIAYADEGEVFTNADRIRENCLKGVDWVVYCLTADLTDRHDIAKQYRVSTREDFLDILEEYCHGPKAIGFMTSTKLSKEDTQINIQSMYVKQFWDGLKSDDRAMSLWTFCYTVLGRKPRWNR
jgi:hypothetical protein